MVFKSQQIHQIDIIRNAFKRSEGKDINDQDAISFALEFTSDILNYPETEKGFTSVPLAGTKSVLN